MTDRMPIGSRLLALILMALVGSALLDRIPDPPTVLQKKIQAFSVVKHKGTTPAAIPTVFFTARWNVPQAPVETAILDTGRPAEEVTADFVRVAGDSSPPFPVV